MPKPNLGNQYQNAMDKVERMARKLLRASKQFDKARQDMQRLAKRMDKLQELI